MRKTTFCVTTMATVSLAVVALSACAVNNDAAAGVGADRKPSEGERAAGPGFAESEVSWSAPITVVTGNATRGPWRMNRSEWDFVDDGTVAINDAGYIGVAWADHPKQDILFQMFSPEGQALLEEPVNISRSGRIFSWLPRMIITDAESPDEIEVLVLWQEIVFSGGSHGGEIFFARSIDGGRTFSTPTNLSNTTAGAGKGRLDASRWQNGSLDFVRGDDATIYAAWTEYEGNLWFSRSTDGERFSRPLHIAGREPAAPARGPSLAIGHDGAIHLAWTVGEDRSANIHFAKSTDDGRTFSEPRVVHESSGHADAPKLIADSKGVLHLVYAESAAGSFRQYRLLYTRAADESRTFEEPREIAQAHRGQYPSIHFPMLRVDGDDRLYVSYELYPAARGRSIGLGFTYSADGGDTFAAPAVVPGSDDPALGFNGSQQGLLMSKLAVNRHGEVAVVSTTYRDGEASRIQLFRGRMATE